jgi:hypothetical protein
MVLQSRRSSHDWLGHDSRWPELSNPSFDAFRILESHLGTLLFVFDTALAFQKFERIDIGGSKANIVAMRRLPAVTWL